MAAPVVGKLTDALSLASRKSTGSAFYVTGALSTLPPEGAERLPGALLDVETISGTDGLGRWGAGSRRSPAPELFYPDLVSFVQEHLSPSYRRSLSGTRPNMVPVAHC